MARASCFGFAATSMLELTRFDREERAVEDGSQEAQLQSQGKVLERGKEAIDATILIDGRKLRTIVAKVRYKKSLKKK